MSAPGVPTRSPLRAEVTSALAAKEDTGVAAALVVAHAGASDPHPQYTRVSELAAVAVSGAYADLAGTPSLATVATTGAYADLTGRPTIPSTAAEVGAQPFDGDLAQLAQIAPQLDDMIVRKGTGWINRNPVQVRADLELSNVDNTSDANKPISTATATALTGKVDLSTIVAKGDLFVGTGAGTLARLPAGTDTHVLTADAAQSSGLKWAAAAGGGGGGDLDLYPPTASGYLDWTADPQVVSADFAHNNGVLLLVRFLYRGATGTLSALGFGVTSAASGPGAYSGVALYADGTGVVNKLGESANSGTSWTSQGVKAVPLITPVAVVKGTYYRAALLWQGSGSGRIAGTPLTILDAIMNNGTRRSTFLAGQTAFPATLTVSSMSTNNALYWITAT